SQWRGNQFKNGCAAGAAPLLNATVKWKAAIGAQWNSPVADNSGALYVTTYSTPSIVAVNASTGSVLWTYAPADLGAMSTTPLITTGGILYAGSSNNKLYAVHTSDGSVKWIADTGTPIYESSVALCPLDGTVYVGTGNNIQAMSPADGSLRWTVSTA